MYVAAEGSLHLNKLKNCWFLLFSGICKLINNGSYIAAFPPHEVILKYNFHYKMFSCSMLDPIFLFYLNLASLSQEGSISDWPWSFLNPPLYFVSTLIPLPRTIRNPSLGGNSWTLLGCSGCYPLLQHRDHLGTTPLPNRADPWFVQTTLGYLKIKHKPTKNPTAHYVLDSLPDYYLSTSFK